MAKIIYDKNIEIAAPTLLLKKRDFTTLGTLTASEISYKNNFNSCNELSFKVYKTRDKKQDALWEEINDYNIVYLPEYSEYFELQVSLSEDTGTYKTITGTSLAENELTNTKIYDIEINTENDMARENYDPNFPVIFYRNPDNYADYGDIWNSDPKYTVKDSYGYVDDAKTQEKRKNILKTSSLLHRILEKASNYKIGYIAPSLMELKTWYQFSISDTNIYDELTGEIAEQYQCLFTFEIKSDGTRYVNAYDLCSTCLECGYRGDFHDICPECGSTEFSGAYGKDTAIFVSKDNLAASASIESNKDELKNCFRVSGGDDIITASVANCNPNGTNYYYCFSDEMLQNMPTVLTEKIKSYNVLYDAYVNTKKFFITESHAADYNKVISYVKEKYPDTRYQTISSLITGYHNISALLYDIIDLELYLESSMMPTPDIDGQSIDEAKNLLTSGSLSPIAVSDSSASAKTVVDNAVLGMAKTYVNTALYKVDIQESEYRKAAKKEENGTWSGIIQLTSIEDNTVTAATARLTITVNSDKETYLNQKLAREMAKSDNAVKDITSMKMPYSEFCKRIQYYSIHYLTGVKESYDNCISIIIGSDNSELYDAMKNQYQERSDKLEAQIAFMTELYQQVSILYDDITAIQEAVKNDLDFEAYLGPDLWNVFCSYRREDSYQNSNFIYDNLDNAALILRTNELIDMAKKELYKAANMQYKVTASLNNLLALKEFQPIVEDFDCGNWIHLAADDKIYYLRLISYSVNFDDLSKIEVEFSTVERIWSGVSDVGSIINSAASIAGSYSATTQQIKNAAKSSKYVENWVQKGLDATATKIVNNADNQDIVWDQTGILCRRYDDIENKYDPYQFKIISNGGYLINTDTNSVKTGIGKFIYLDPNNNFQETVGYGVIADTIVSDIVLTKELGIYSPNGGVKINGEGITLDGGKITWTSPVNSSDVSGLEEYKTNTTKSLEDFKASLGDALGVTEITSDSVISPKIGGGYLYIKDARETGNTGISVEINPNGTSFNGHSGNYIFNIQKDNSLIMGVDHNGTGYFTGSINGGSININNRFLVDPEGNVTLPPGTKLSWADIKDTDSVATKSYVTGQGYQTASQVTQITENTIQTGNLTADNLSVKAANIQGQLNASQINTTGLIAENISGATISGKTIEGSTISSVSGNYSTNISNGVMETTLIKLIPPVEGSGFVPGIARLNSAKDEVICGLYFYDDRRIETNGNLYVGINGTKALIANRISSDVVTIGPSACRPIEDKGATCGSSSCRWADVYSTKSNNNTSDRNLKHDIYDISEIYEKLFYKLKPVTYMLNSGDRTHMGFISQDLEESMNELGLSALDCAAFCKDIKTVYEKDENGEEVEKQVIDENGQLQYIYGIRYGEFIALNTHMIQKLYKENEQLKQRIEKLEQAMA